MKKLLLASFLFSYCFIANAQRLILEKTRFLGTTTGGSAGCNSALPTDDGGILFTGTAYNSGGDIPQNPYAIENVLLGKLDSSLNISWIKVYGGSQTDRGKQLCQAADGSYMLLAESESLDGDFSLNTGGTGGRDVWLCKLDNNGNFLWSKNYGSPSDDAALSIAATADSGFIVLGNSNGAGGDIPFHYTTSPFSLDWFVLKVDKDGNKQWCKTIGGTGDESVKGKILAANNSYYLISGSSSKDHDCMDTSWHPASVNTSIDIYVIKLDTGGNVLWSKSYGGSNSENASSAEINSDSSIIIAGYSNSNDYEATGNHSSAPNGDMWILKTDKAGTLIWSRMCGGKNDELGWPILQKLKDNTYLALTETQPGQYGTHNIWAFNLDKDGNILMDYQFGGSVYDYIYSALTLGSSCILAGSSSSNSFNEGTSWGRQSTVNWEAFFSRFSYFPAGIAANKKNVQGLMVYPNPTKGIINVQLPEGTSEGILEVYDMAGKLLCKRTVSQMTRVELNVSGWSKGSYQLIWKDKTNKTATANFLYN